MSRLGICEICDKKSAKYTCPACDINTCSLACISSHKKSTDCDGLRSQTSFVPLSKFDELHLLNDVRLLEGIGRMVDKCGKDKTKKFSRINKDLPLHLTRLKAAAHHRGTRLLFLPQHFTRHKNNTTFLDWRNRTITWRLQLTFLNAEMLTYNEERCSENLVLEEILRKYLTATTTTPKVLRPYQKVGIESIDVLMKAEKASDPIKKFYKLDMKKSLKDNLAKKIIVEFPQLYILIQNFYTAKKVTEKDNIDAKKPKTTDYLQLGNHENENLVDDNSSSSSEDEESSDDDDEMDIDLIALETSNYLKSMNYT